MDCPVCLEPIEPLTLFDVEIDACKFCGGVWLDAGELASYIQKGNVPKRILADYCLDTSRMQIQEGRRQCPRCKDVMKVVPHMGVNVEVCERCKGLWFDRGEIGAIMKKYFEEADPRKMRKKSSSLQTSTDDQGNEIISIVDSDMREFMQQDSTPSSAATGLNDVEQEFLAGGGKEAVAKALPESAKKTKDPFALASLGSPMPPSGFGSGYSDQRINIFGGSDYDSIDAAEALFSFAGSLIRMFR